MSKNLLFTFLFLAVPAGAADAASCAHTRGAAAAKVLVQRCLQVSPATHPPCNAQNACSLIVSEIKRGCSLLKGSGDRPGFCKQY